MPRFEAELMVPNIKPETSIPIIKINQPVLRDSLDSLLERYEEYMKQRGEKKDER